MEFFKWDEHFLTGLKRIDEQHHQLVNIMNDFIRLLTREENAPKAEIERVFGLLGNYAHQHFSDEEAMMRAVGIDQRHFSYQQQQHRAYILEITREQKNIANDPASALTLLGFLGQWLMYHILGADQSMAKQISAIHSGLTPAEAYEQEKVARQKSTEPLLHALNAMAEQVMARNGQLIRANETLEARVAERTQALQVANASLSETVNKLEMEMAESQRLSAELARANDHLQHLAQTDALTGLPNRRHAMDRLAQLWAESQRHGSPFSCIMLDADGFKQVNDTYGHEAGDIVLRELARHLLAFTRTEDMVCRLGGDEFLILCPQTSLTGAQLLAEHLRSKVNALRIPACAGEWHGSLSLGVAEIMPTHTKPDDLIIAADSGLYIAKRRGRNQVAVAGND